MRLRFLGTGTSFGVPVIGCRCAVCSSENPRNRRTRHALLLEQDDRRLLVDTPPELRLQILDAGVDRVDAVFLTHPHADHVHGIDDLRAFTGEDGVRIPLFVAKEHRGKGLSKRLVEAVRAHPDLQGLRRMLLVTRDAHGLYSRFGFKPLAAPERFMEIHAPDVYSVRRDAGQ